jgi:PDZ domain-containing protein
MVCAFVLPLPYTIFSPGETVDLLGANGGQPVVTVGKGGPKLYRDRGQLRMVTVQETLRSHHPRLAEVLSAWLSDDDAVWPISVAYPDQQGSAASDHKAGAEMMTSAQDVAAQVAVSSTGVRVFHGVIVGSVTAGAPASSVLKVGDVITSVGATPITTPLTLTTAVHALRPGKPQEFGITRAGKPMTVSITPAVLDGRTRIGIAGASGNDLMSVATMPYDVHVNIPAEITGPSAGLMMTLTIYDELTPGSLTGGATVAGTGTMDQSGEVGEIGGIQQKIPAAKDDGAQLFLVPSGNCADALGADHGSMRLAKVTTFADALKVVQTWAANHNAPLPSC